MREPDKEKEGEKSERNWEERNRSDGGRVTEKAGLDKHTNPDKATVKSGTSFPMVVISHSLI
jgi:hypothetical protein